MLDTLQEYNIFRALPINNVYAKKKNKYLEKKFKKKLVNNRKQKTSKGDGFISKYIFSLYN